MQEPTVSQTFPAQPVASDSFRLLVMEADERVRALTPRPKAGDLVSFGRQDGNAVQLFSLLVSREHGWFEQAGGQWYVCEREGVANHLLVNGQPLTRISLQGQAVMAARLSGGDTLRIDAPAGSHEQGLQAVFIPAAEQVSGVSVPLGPERSFTIGREPSCDIVVPHVSVSREHATLTRQGGAFILQDNHSTNGTLLNNRPVVGAVRVERRDVIGVANAHIFVSLTEAFVITQENGFALEASGLTKRVWVKKNKDRSFGFERRTILDDASVSIAPGEFVAIIGGSGTGKSTLLGALSGFSRADKGRVLTRGQDLYAGFPVLKSGIGYVPQKDIVFERLTLERMLMYAARMRMPSDTSDAERADRVKEVAAVLEFDDQSMRNRIGVLSGGQRKRASIAVELLADPGLFFLDEPTSGLDPGTERSLMEALRRISRQGKTVVLVTHTTLNLRLCDKVIVMGAEGRVCSCLSPEDTKRYYHVSDLVDVYDIVKTRRDEFADQYGRRGQSIAEARGPRPRPKRGSGLSFTRQYLLLTRRGAELALNNAPRVVGLLAQAPILSLIVSAAARPKSDVFTMYPLTKTILFTLVIAAIWMGTLGAVTEICKERAIARRELIAGMSRAAYLTSKLTTLSFGYIIQTALTLAAFCLLARPPDPALVAWGHWPLNIPLFSMGLALFAAMLASGCMALAVSSWTSSPDTANVFALYLVLPQLVFSGVIFKMPDGVMEAVKQPVIAHWAMKALASAINATALDMPYLMPDVQALQQAHDALDLDEYAHSLANFGGSLGMLGLIALVSLAVCAAGVSRMERRAE
ncbi:MAG: ATP-binding cassette domain-containing protein [Oscillospiraceae bacterium]|jgi:ABC-type multidrug transport system ATPase subunit|nr:ATP-binding cassette domain-containing protein [Oscillospiraceae bacterium]